MQLLQAIQEPHRREALRLIWQRELSAGEIHRQLGDISFGAVSQHLRVLRDAGLVRVRPVGRHRYYRAQPEEFGGLALWLESMWASSLTQIRDLAEAEDAPVPPTEDATP